MRISSVFSEAVRNIATGTSRVVLHSLVFGVVVGLLVASDTISTRALIEEGYQYQRGGAAILTVSAPQSIDGDSCEALNDVSHVQAAGALKVTDERLLVSALPRSPVDLYKVTAGFPGTLEADYRAESGVVLTTDVAEAVGPVPDGLMTNHGRLPVAGTFDYPADGRRTGFGWAALVPISSVGVFDECWVALWPYTDRLRSLLLTTVSASSASDVEVTISQLNARFGRDFLGSERYASRFTSLNAPILAGVGFAAALFSLRPRRLEFASRLHDGGSRASLHGLVLIETAVWLVIGAVLAVSVAAGLLAGLQPDDAKSVFIDQMLSGACAVLGGLLGCMSGASLIRERQLFAFFKDR